MLCNCNYELTRGDTFGFLQPVKDGGKVFDATGWTVTASLATKKGIAIPATITCAWQGALTLGVLAIDSNDSTSAWAVGGAVLTLTFENLTEDPILRVSQSIEFNIK